MKRIKLTQGKFAMVDDADFEWLNQWKWHTAKGCNTYYARRAGPRPKQKPVFMHREIISPSKHLETDHRNGNGLDNRRENIRACTLTENRRNSVAYANNRSGFKGVSSFTGKWVAQISYNNKTIYLGRFVSKVAAARAYDEGAKKYYGEFAKLNFPTN